MSARLLRRAVGLPRPARGVGDPRRIGRFPGPRCGDRPGLHPGGPHVRRGPRSRRGPPPLIASNTWSRRSAGRCSAACGAAPVPDPRRGLLAAMLAKLASAIPDERTAGLSAAPARPQTPIASASAAAFTLVRPQRRELAVSVTNFAAATRPLKCGCWRSVGGAGCGRSRSNVLATSASPTTARGLQPSPGRPWVLKPRRYYLLAHPDTGLAHSTLKGKRRGRSVTGGGNSNGPRQCGRCPPTRRCGGWRCAFSPALRPRRGGVKFAASVLPAATRMHPSLLVADEVGNCSTFLLRARSCLFPARTEVRLRRLTALGTGIGVEAGCKPQSCVLRSATPK